MKVPTTFRFLYDLGSRAGVCNCDENGHSTTVVRSVRETRFNASSSNFHQSDTDERAEDSWKIWNHAAKTRIGFKQRIESPTSKINYSKPVARGVKDRTHESRTRREE